MFRFFLMILIIESCSFYIIHAVNLAVDECCVLLTKNQFIKELMYYLLLCFRLLHNFIYIPTE